MSAGSPSAQVIQLPRHQAFPNQRCSQRNIPVPENGAACTVIHAGRFEENWLLFTRGAGGKTLGLLVLWGLLVVS